MWFFLFAVASSLAIAVTGDAVAADAFCNTCEGVPLGDDTSLLSLRKPAQQQSKAVPASESGAEAEGQGQRHQRRRGCTAYRASVLHFVDNPLDKPLAEQDQSLELFVDGVLVVDGDGLILYAGEWGEDRKSRCQRVIRGQVCRVANDYRGKIIMPGSVDAHVHAPQAEIIASFGDDLLAWLNTYTFPAELKYNSTAWARARYTNFIELLLRAGTTTALIFATRHVQATDILFELLYHHNLRAITGLTLMDDNPGSPLQDESAEQADEEQRFLIRKWHEKGRLTYAVTPRFGLTSSQKQLDLAGQTMRDFPTVHMHTHLAESFDEIAGIQDKFCQGQPKDACNYVSVYEDAGLTGSLSHFAHSIHLSQNMWDRLVSTGSTVTWCPTSNNFLGSGLFNLGSAVHNGVPVAMGTDIGAGTSLSMAKTAGEAYKVSKLTTNYLHYLYSFTNASQDCPNPLFPECGVAVDNSSVASPFQAFYLMTLGGARALKLDQYIGNFQEGKEADFQVIDFDGSTALQSYRQQMQFLVDSGIFEDRSKDILFQKLFILMQLSNERNVVATHVLGEPVFRRHAVSEELEQPASGK